MRSLQTSCSISIFFPFQTVLRDDSSCGTVHSSIHFQPHTDTPTFLSTSKKEHFYLDKCPALVFCDNTFHGLTCLTPPDVVFGSHRRHSRSHSLLYVCHTLILSQHTSVSAFYVYIRSNHQEHPFRLHIDGILTPTVKNFVLFLCEDISTRTHLWLKFLKLKIVPSCSALGQSSKVRDTSL